MVAWASGTPTTSLQRHRRRAGCGWSGRSGWSSDGIKVVAWVNSSSGPGRAMFCYALLRQRARAHARPRRRGSGPACRSGVVLQRQHRGLRPAAGDLLAPAYVLLAPRLTTGRAGWPASSPAWRCWATRSTSCSRSSSVAVRGRPGTGGRVGGAGRGCWRWFPVGPATALAVVAAATGSSWYRGASPVDAPRSCPAGSPATPTTATTGCAGHVDVSRRGFRVARAIVGGHFMFRLDWVRDTLERRLPRPVAERRGVPRPGLWRRAWRPCWSAAVVGTAAGHGVRPRHPAPARGTRPGPPVAGARSSYGW